MRRRRGGCGGRVGWWGDEGREVGREVMGVGEWVEGGKSRPRTSELNQILGEITSMS